MMSNNSTHVVVMDTAAGIVHADNGDNYSGFNTTSSVYTAQVAGWYLAIYEAFATYAGTPSTASLVVGLQTSSSGGRSPSASIDWYQQMFPSSASLTFRLFSICISSIRHLPYFHSDNVRL